MVDTVVSDSALANLYLQHAAIGEKIKEATYEVSTRSHNDSDKLADQLVQQYIGANQATERQTDRLVDRADQNALRNDNEIRSLDTSNEQRATRGVDQLLNESRFLDIGAARRADAITLAATLNARDVASQNERNTDRVNQETRLVGDKVHSEVQWTRNETRDNAKAAVIQGFDLSAKVSAENQATRDLINTQYAADLARRLSETHTELVELRHEHKQCERDWAVSNNNALISQFTSQLNALNSQIQETKQGVVNFGSMSGNAGRQASTNNVA
jgi:hypothetical protein